MITESQSETVSLNAKKIDLMIDALVNINISEQSTISATSSSSSSSSTSDTTTTSSSIEVTQSFETVRSELKSEIKSCLAEIESALANNI